MSMNYDNKKMLDSDCRLITKLSILNLIFTTIICIAPPIWLIIRVVNNDTNKLLVSSIATIISVSYMVFTWCKFFYDMKIYNLELELEGLEDLVNGEKK